MAGRVGATRAPAPTGAARASASGARPERPLALVLSGGGARGAFEVGVVAWLAEHMPEVLEAVGVLTGTSVGAIHAAFLAAGGLSLDVVRELEAIWRRLRLERVVRPSVRSGLRMLGAGARRWFGTGGSPPLGFLDTSGLDRIVRERIDWQGLHAHVREGRIRALAVTATEIGSGQTHVFIEAAPGLSLPRPSHDPRLQPRAAVLGPRHVRASAAIPLLFRPVEIDGLWFTDGGLRLSTPLSSALRLGADRLLVVRVTSSQTAAARPGAFPGLGQLMGKLLNSVFLDRLAWDLDRLQRVNDLLCALERVGGRALVQRVREELASLGRRPYRYVRHAVVGPPVDLGVLAARALRRGVRPRGGLGRLLRAMLASDNLALADGASYLLFDGRFAGELIDLGRAAAQAGRRDFEALLA